MMSLPDYRDDPVLAARHRCADITRQHARNFYYGLKLLPQPKRDAMYVVYAWMRRADDCADGDIEGNPNPSVARRREALDRFERQTLQVFNGDDARGLNLFIALKWAIDSFPLSIDQFKAMLTGQRFDLEVQSIESRSQLLEYCRLVGSSVGRISIDIWGFVHRDAKVLADDRGIAFQLTNIIRDFAEDHDNGRVYLPREDFDRHDLTPADLRRWRNPEACEALLREYVQRARDYYDSSDRLDELIEDDCRAASVALTRIYRGLLDKLERNLQSAATGRRISLAPVSKLLIAARARRSARQMAGVCSVSSQP